MGTGIAHVCALAGYDVKLSDVSQDQAAKATAVIGKNMDRQVRRGTIEAGDRNAALKRITTGTGLDMFADSDIVIEAASENEEIKREIFKQLCPVLKPAALICSNTSSISITRLASVTDRPAKFMGMHFMNPVPLPRRGG